MNYYKTERHYATYHFTDTRLKQDTKIVNNTRKLYLEILQENSQKTGAYPSKIFSCLKRLSRALEIYQNTIVSLEYYLKYLGRQNRLKDILEVYMKNLTKTIAKDKKKGYPIVERSMREA